MSCIHDLSTAQRLNLYYSQAIHYAIVMIDLDGKIVDWSPGAEYLMGWTAAEAVGKSAAMIFTPEEREAGTPEAEMETARRNGYASDVRWHLRRDGSRFFVDGILSAIRDEKGALIGYGKILRDITTRKEVTDYFRNQSSLLDYAYDPVFSWKLESNHIVYWNKAAENLYGLTSNDVIGSSPHVLLETVFPEGLKAIKETLKQTGRWQGELIHTIKGNGKIHVESRMVLRNDIGDEPIVLEANRDETVEKRAQAALKASEQRFRTLVSAISKVVLQFGPDGSLHIDSFRWRAFTGQSYEEARGFGWLSAIHHEGRAATAEGWANAVKSEKFYETTLRICNAKGEYRWVQMRAAPVLSDDGAVREWVAAFADITDARRAEEASRESAERTQIATDAAKLGVWMWKIDEDIVAWENERMYDIFGIPKTSVPLNATRFFGECIYPGDADATQRALTQSLETSARLEITTRIYRQSDKALRWIEVTGLVHHDSEGRPESIVGTVADITERKQAEAQLQESKQTLELAINATGLGLYDYSPLTGRLHCSAEAKSHFGVSPAAEVNYGDFLHALHPQDRERVQSQSEKLLLEAPSKEPYHLTYRTVGIEDGRVRWIDTWGRVIANERGEAARAIGTTLDITAHKTAEESIRKMALHDPLTGLPNRRLLFEYADHVFSWARRASHHSGILFVDLDRFKPINDNYGHETGDEVLKEAARRMVQCVRAEDFVFRLGGDEFLVLLPEIGNAASAGDVARHMAHCIEQPYTIDQRELSLSASVGISIFPQDGEDIDTLMHRADAAMYVAKHEGRNNIRFYSQELTERSETESLIEEYLRRAFSQNTFKLYYQPVVDTTSARLIGVEALLRWPHEELGPERFVPVAESTGQINRLGDWVIEEACRQHLAWRKRGLPTIPIAINVSPVQFRQKDFVSRFAQIRSDCKIGISALQMEVTETALMENVDHAIDVLTELRSLGVKIALDDFGTGYSSLNYLSRLPINKIKVDKSFVQRIGTDTASRAITEAVIALGRTLDLEVVAEGIESKEVLHYLRQHGCTQAQGFYLCEPLSADSFECWYREHGESLVL